jgi:2,3-bisphosphoglycerate-dependent phosphoglycerate mutase
MTRALIVRHGQTTANATGVLAGRTEVELNDVGRRAAESLGAALTEVPLERVITSPMLRTRQTAELLLAARHTPVDLSVDDGLAEVEYGEWTGRALAELAKEDLWRTVQVHPASVTFPNGEAMAAMSARAVASVRAWCARSDDSANLLFVSHGDVIKAILADALGMHLDAFQRIVVHPTSLSVVNYVHGRPFVERINDCNGDLGDLVPPAPAEAVPGGTKGR